jgi:hypothetical protein
VVNSSDSRRDQKRQPQDAQSRRDKSSLETGGSGGKASPRQFFRPRFRVRPAEQERDFVLGYN